MSIFKWVFENIAPGGTEAAKRVDADRIMDNFETLATAHRPRARGIDTVDGNTNGSSTTTQCNITIYTDQGELGLLALNDWVIVEDDSDNIWNLQNTLAADELSFSVTHLISGSTPGDYSDVGFINGLEIMINPGRVVLGKNQLGLSGSHAQKITGSDIETSSADTAKIGAALPAVQTQIDVEHEAGGGHSADIIAVTNIAPAALIDENQANLVYGTMDYDDDEDGYPNGWKAYNSPTSGELSTTQVREGVYSFKLVASQPSDGTETDATEITLPAATFKGRNVAARCSVYCTTTDTAKIEIYDGVGTSASAAGGTGSAWDEIYIARSIDAAATELTIRIYATQATTIYIDEVMVCLGELPAGFAPHADEAINARLADASPANFCLNGDFAEWSNGVGGTDFPDFWTGTCNLQPEGGPGDGGYGIQQAKCIFAIGETFSVSIPSTMLSFFKGRTVYFVAEVASWAANTKDLRMQVDDGVGTTVQDVTPGVIDNYARRGVKHDVDSAATGLTISFENQDAGTISANIRNVMLCVDNAPIGFIPPVYKTVYLYFGLNSLGTSYAYMNAPTGLAAEVPFPSPGIIQSLGVTLAVAPGGVTTTDYEIWFDGGALANYHCDIDATDTEDADSVTVAQAQVIDSYDGTNHPTIGVKAVREAEAVPQNAQAVVKILTWS